MNPAESVRKMWTEYHLSLGLPAPSEPIADSFCNNEKETNELAGLVNRGIKRATASALWTCEKLKIKIPKIGDIFVVKDWSGNAVCIVKTIRVTVVPFNQITEEHAAIEGEGDRTLAYWRRVHLKFYKDEFKDLGLTFDESMPIIFEEFEKVFPHVR